MIGVDPQTVDDAGVETVVEAAIGPVMNALADAGHSVTEDEVGAFLFDMFHDLVVRDHESAWIDPVMAADVFVARRSNRVDVRFTSNGDVLHVDPSWLSTCS